MRKTPGGRIHHPPPPSSRAVEQPPGLGGRSSALVGFCRGNARHGMIEPTRGRPRHRDGRPRAAKICGGRLPRCRATAVLPPSGVTPKCGWTRVSAFRRRTGSPLAPPRCAPSVGAPSRALAARAALGPADSVPCARPSAAACASLDLMDVARAAALGARRTRRRPETRRRARA